MKPIRPVLPLAAVAALAAIPAVASAERMSIVYDERATVATLVSPSGPGAPLGAARGLFRQDPGGGGILDPDEARNAAHRVAKVSAKELAPLPAEAMADRLQHEIDTPEVPNTSGLVAIDEIGNTFNDGRARITYKYVKVRGKRIKVSSVRKLVITARGWKLKRVAAPLPKVLPDSPGSKLSAAMEMLAARPHPAGGSYAERVHLYIAPAFGTSIAAGRGPHRHLGNDGKPHRATWRGVMPALARAGGVWVEMYHHSGTTYSLTAKEWRTVPQAFTAYGRRFGVDPGRLHMMFAGSPSVPKGAKGCSEPMACQWSLAAATPAGRAMLANGPGAYKLGAQAAAWRQGYNGVFGAS